MANTPGHLFVTYVDPYQELLRIWGQTNRTCATYIEKQLIQLVPMFNRTPGPIPEFVHPGMFCFAKYVDNNYYRARIITGVYGNAVTVQFIDHGNKDRVDLSNIRIKNGSVEDVLMKIVPQAEEFYLANVASQGSWTSEALDRIIQDLCYEDHSYRIVCQSDNIRLIDIDFQNQNYATFLLNKNIARYFPVKDQILMLKSTMKNQLVGMEQMNPNIQFHGNPNYGYQSSQSESSIRRESYYPQSKPNPPQRTPTQTVHHMGPQHMVPNMMQYPPMGPPTTEPCSSSSQQGPHVNHSSPPLGQVQNVPNYGNKERQYNHTAPTSQLPPTPSSNNPSGAYSDGKSGQVINSVVIEALANQLKQHLMKDSNSETTPESHSYITQVLEVGSTHSVYVSCIDDGPWSFSIQLVSCEHELNQLMDDLAASDLMPVKLPVVLGYPCIAKSQQFDSYCRGVVVNISHSAVKIFFVDFGNTEDLPVSSVFELPPKFFKVKAMSQKFALSGLQRIKPIEEIKRAFIEVVDNELLLLHVTTLEGENLPTCDLYLKNVNIKRILNEKVRQIRKWDPIQFPKQGSIENVVVTWIDGPQKFFVQLVRNDRELKILKSELAEWGVVSSMFSPDELVPGAVCVSCYSYDKKWYRAVITSVNSKTSVTVFYVDYGNKETVSPNMIRKVGNGLIRQMNTQAIECCLLGYENKLFDPNLTKALEGIILERELRMQVIYTEQSRIIVKLYDNDKDVLSLLQSPYSPPPFIPVPGQVKMEEPLKIMEEKTRNVANQKTDSRNRGDSQANKNRASDDSNKSWRKKEDRFGTGDKINNDITYWRAEDNKKGGSGAAKESKNDRTGGSSWRKSGRKEGSEDEGDRRGSGWGANSNDFDGRKPFGQGKKFDKQNDWVKGKLDERKDGKDENLMSRMKRVGQENQMKGKKMMETLTRLPVKLDNIVSRGIEFKEKHVTVGSVEDVIVTYFVNPSEIYVQLLSSKDIFKNLMDEMQAYYITKLPLVNYPRLGDNVVAQFKEDCVLYRAVVINLNPLTVRYADYGNEEVIAKSKVWAMDKKFIELEAQCLKCSLPDIVPVGRDTWPEPDPQIDEIFEHEQYTCTFMNLRDDGVYNVKLIMSDSGKDVSDELVASGFAARKETQGEESGDLVEQDMPMDFSLMLNETYKVYITDIVDDREFYVQIQSTVKQIVEETRTESDEHNILPEDIPGYSLRLVRCSLNHNFDEFPVAARQEFEKCRTKYFLASVNDMIHDKLKVTLYDLKGEKLELLAGANDEPEQIRPFIWTPILNRRIVVVPLVCTSPREIYIHCFLDTPLLTELNDNLAEFYAEEREKLEDGETVIRLCAAKSASYGSWYRARVLSFNENFAKVLYIDFGNIEDVPRENIRNLDPVFLEHYAFSKKVSLNIEYKEEFEDELTQRLKELVEEKKCLGYFAKVDDTLFADFEVNKESVTGQLLKIGGARKIHEHVFPNAKSNTVIEEAEPTSLVDESKVFISHVSSPNEFWIHRESISNELDAFQESMQNFCANGTVKKDLSLGDVVGACFLDKIWCRAKVTKINGDIISVQFIDYGNSVDVDKTGNGVIELTEQLVNVPVFASFCSLKGRWKEGASARFEGIITNKQDPFTLVELEDGPGGRIVDLLDNGSSITEQLLSEGYGEDIAEPEPVKLEAEIPAPSVVVPAEPTTDPVDPVPTESEIQETTETPIESVSATDNDEAPPVKEENETENVGVSEKEDKKTNETIAVPSENERGSDNDDEKSDSPESLSMTVTLPSAESDVESEQSSAEVHSAEDHALKSDTTGLVNRLTNGKAEVTHSENSGGKSLNETGTSVESLPFEETTEKKAAPVTKSVKVEPKKSEVLPEKKGKPGKPVVENVKKEKRPITKPSTLFRNRNEKIIPGSVSRGEKPVTAKQSARGVKVAKTPISEKLVPGAITGPWLSMEEMSTTEKEPEPVRPKSQSSVSAPGTPSPNRRERMVKTTYHKLKHQDRLVPGSISSGIVIENFPVPKVSYDDKMISSAVNGTKSEAS